MHELELVTIANNATEAPDSLAAQSRKSDEDEEKISESNTASISGGDKDVDPTMTDVEKEAGEERYLNGFKLFALLACVTMAAFLMLLDGSIIGVAIPAITTEFHSLNDVGWYTSAYQLASAALQPFSGKLFTYFKAKWTYLAFFALFELGSLLCAVANSSTMLIVGRAVAGMGGSGLLNGGLTMVAAAVPLKKRPACTGIYLGIAQAAIVCGPLIGGGFTEGVSWRWCFYINLPPGAIVAVLLVYLNISDVTEKDPFTFSMVRRTLPELDLVGFALFCPAAVMFLLALQFGGTQYPWDSSVVIGLFVGAGATLIVFMLWERYMGERAMMPKSLLRMRIVWCSAINGATIVVAVLVASQYLPIYFQGVRGFNPAIGGVATLPAILSQIISVILSGIFIQKTGYYLPFAAVGTAVAAIGNGLISTLSPTTNIGNWIGYQIVLGSGRGIAMQTGIIAVQNALSEQQVSIGVAFIIFCQNFAGAIFTMVAYLIFSQELVKEVRKQAPSVPPAAVLEAGASPGAVRALVLGHSNELSGILNAYADSINAVFYLLVACSLVGCLAAFGMGWVNIKKKSTS